MTTFVRGASLHRLPLLLLSLVSLASCGPSATSLHDAASISVNTGNMDKDVACDNKILTIQFNRPLYAFCELFEQAREYLRHGRIQVGYEWENKLATYTVSNAAELSIALKAVVAGDKILLAAGDYGSVAIKNLQFDTDITISSRDPSAQAIISKLDVTGSKGITFTDLEFSTVGSTKMGGLFSVVESSKITFDDVYVHGSMNGNPQDDVDGIGVLRSKDIKIINSEFEQLRNAISHRDNDGLIVSGNHIHDIRLDGVRGSGSSNVVISKNYISDFYRADGDHADAIQFYTGNTIYAAKNITITDNIIDRGDGMKMQGIFIRDENLKLPYENITITGNVLIGTNTNGIAVTTTKNLEISGNTIVSPLGEKSWIRVWEAESVTVTNNYVRDSNTSQYLYGDIKGLVEYGNKSGGAVTDGGAATLEVWLKAHPDVQLHFYEALTGKLAPDASLSTEQPGETAGSPTEEGMGGSMGEGAGGFIGEKAGGSIVEEPRDGVLLHASGGSGDLVGGTGVDTVSFSGMKSAVRLSLEVETRQNMLGGGKGAIINVENIEGSQFNDTITGNVENNVLKGGDGADRLDGGLGADTLFGGAGADSFHISTEANSTVALEGRDVIMDFNRAEGDRIIVRDIDAKQGGVDDPFTFVAKFTGVAGQLISVAEGDHYVVMGDTNGDGHADFAVNVFSDTPLIRSDFLL